MVTIKTELKIANERDEYCLKNLSKPDIIKKMKTRDNTKWALVEDLKIEMFKRLKNNMIVISWNDFKRLLKGE